MNTYLYKVSPAFVFLGVVVFGLVLSAVSIWVAVSQPQIDLPAGAVLVQVGAIDIVESDRIEEPDQLGSNAAIQAFVKRQSLIRTQLDQSQVEVTYRLIDGTTAQEQVDVRARHLSDLPWMYWFQISVGLVSLFIGGWVLGLRRDDWGARMFALTAFFLSFATHSAAIYSTRQIALDGTLFHALSSINAYGSMAFGTALVAMFTQYPKRLFRLIWMVIPAIVFALGATMNNLRVGPDNMIGLIILTQMMIALILGAVQWYLSRREPLNRAGLRWFLLVSLVGCSLFIFLNSAPITLGLADKAYVPQGIAFGFFNIMHVGLALGVLRYKVFNLDRWSYYVWLWLGGMLLVFVLDVLLIRFLDRQPWVSLSMALLLAGFLYFPLRQLLLRLLLQRNSVSLSGRMAEIVSAALSPTNREHELRWDRLLSELFLPLAPPEKTDQQVTTPRIAENGLALLIPGVDGLEPRRLRYALRGRRLFSHDDLEVVANVVQMHELAAESRRAYERGIILERDRISKDVHDNIGAQLLSALHTREVTRKDDLLRDSLSDLRSIIDEGFQAEFGLLPILADLRAETAQRLEAHNISLLWSGPETRTSDVGPIVSFELVNCMRSILREAVSNILRHSQASSAWINASLHENEIDLEIEDDGKGLPGDGSHADGNGIPNILDRAQVLMGIGNVGKRDGGKTGTRIHVSLPLHPDERRRQAAE